MTDLGDPKAVSRRTKENMREAHLRKQMLEAIMNLRQGRDWVAEQLERCHPNAPSFSNDPLVMAFREGERNIGLQLLADITSATPDQYILLLKEQGERNATRRTRSDDDDDNANPSGGHSSDSGADDGAAGPQSSAIPD